MLVLDVEIVEPLDRVDVRETHERPLGLDEVRVELLDERSRRRVGEQAVDGLADDRLDVRHKVVEREKRELGLEVRVLGEVAARVRVLGAERLLHAEDVAERGQACLEVELGGLGEERGLAVVVELEECGATFDLCLDEARWRNLEEIVRSERSAEASKKRSTKLENRGGSLAA